MNEKWKFLEGSYWYVPTQYLPATQMGATDSEPNFMIDQTVWQITSYRDGYFWGNCVALIYAKGEEPGAPNGLKMIGSITPDGSVQISFMQMNQLGAATSISGWGKMVKQHYDWAFEMQMSSGLNVLTSHWASMYSTIEGAPSWNKLPGVEYSVPAFLEAAGFEVQSTNTPVTY